MRLFLFFIQSSGYLRDLPSFPTRRSSDLNPLRALTSHGRVLQCSNDSAQIAPECLSRESASRKHARSEEHTSELQSLRHLVCRLLLEKKKNWIKWRLSLHTKSRLTT